MNHPDGITGSKARVAKQGGGQRAEDELVVNHPAVVSMQAWETGTREQHPGRYRVFTQQGHPAGCWRESKGILREHRSSSWRADRT